MISNAPGRYAIRVHRDADDRWRLYRERNGIPLDAPFQGRQPAVEAYEEALDALNYARAGGLPSVAEAAVLLAQACLDIMEPGWRTRR